MDNDNGLALVLPDVEEGAVAQPPYTRLHQRRLNDRRTAFVNYYCGEARFNAEKAATLAGYTNLHAIVPLLMRDPLIKAAIQAVLDARLPPADAIIAELADVGFADWRDFLRFVYNRNGEIVDVKLDMNAKMKALELLGRNRQLFTDNVNVNANVTTVREYREGDGQATEPLKDDPDGGGL